MALILVVDNEPSVRMTLNLLLKGKGYQVLEASEGWTAIAYPFRHLSRQPLVNDLIAGRPVAVVFSKEGATGVVFSRQAGGRTLTFGNLRREQGDLVMDDRETGSTWRALAGLGHPRPAGGDAPRADPGDSGLLVCLEGLLPRNSPLGAVLTRAV